MQEWSLQEARNKDVREAKRASIEQKHEETARLEAEHAQAEASLEEIQAKLAVSRQSREALQQEAAQVTAELAGLEERRRGAEASFQRIDRLHAALERRGWPSNSSASRGEQSASSALLKTHHWRAGSRNWQVSVRSAHGAGLRLSGAYSTTCGCSSR